MPAFQNAEAGRLHEHEPTALTSSQHMETFHPEGQSPFVPMDPEHPSAHASEPSSDPGKSSNDEQYLACPVSGCGEILLMDEMDFHIEMHAEEAEGDEHPESQIQDSDISHGAREADETAKSNPADGPSRIRRERERDREAGKGRERDRGRETRRERSPPEAAVSRQAKAIKAWKNLLHMPSPRRQAGTPASEGSEKSKRLGVG